MVAVTGSAAHGAGSNHANAAPPDLPIEPRRKETPEEHRARMEEKSARLRRFSTGEKAAEVATYHASVQPRAEEPDLDEDTDVEPDVVDVAPAAPQARPVPAPPRVPARRPTEDEQRNLAIVTAYEQGDSLKVLATRYHLGQVAVREILVAAGVQVRPTGRPATPAVPERDAAAAERDTDDVERDATPADRDEQAPTRDEPQPQATSTSPARSRFITGDELAAMVADYEEGKTPPEIAAATGRTAKNVRTALERAGVQMRDDRALRSGGQNRRVDDQALVDDVRRLYVDEGLSQAAVAERLDCTVKVIQGVMARNGIESRPDAAGIKREKATPPERTARYRDPDAAARATTADVGPSVTPPLSSSRPVFAASLADLPLPARPPALSLDEALAAAGDGVRALLAAVEDLTTAALHVHEARVAAAQASVADIHQAADQLLAALGEPTTEGVPA